MKVKVWANGTNKVACLSLLCSYKGNINIFHEKKEDLCNGEHYQCYSTPMFSIVRFDSSKKEGSKVLCEFEGDGIIMSFQKKGKASCESDKQKGKMHEKENNIFLHNKCTKCSLTEADCFRVILSKSYVDKLYELYPRVMEPLIIAFQKGENCIFGHSHLNTTLEMERTINDIENLYLQQEDEKQMVIEAKVRELLYSQIMHHLKLINNKDLKIEKYREQMQIACRYIEENMREIPSLHDIAMNVGVCDTILKIAFKYFYGKTVFEYYNEYRLNMAFEYLLNPSYSISEVAFLSGYKHSSHFSTAFKQKYGITPIKYRIENINKFTTPSSKKASLLIIP